MKRLFLSLAFILLFTFSAHATVSDATYKIVYTCNSSTTAFPFTFGIGATSEVKVTETVSATGVETAYAETTDYTVACTNSDCSAGGTVNTVSTCATGRTLTLEMNVPYTQASDFTEGMPTLYETFEDGLDKLTRIAQQLKGYASRTPMLPATSTTTWPTLANPIAGQYLRWNTAGTGIESTSSVSSTGTYTASGTGGTARTVDAKLSDMVAAEDYGATGDGTTDDTTAIQYMINANTNVIWNTHGKTYIISNVTTSGTLTITGGGTLKHVAAATDHMIEASGTLALDGVTIDGNKANQTGRYATIYFNGTKLSATNTTFHDTKAAGIFVDDGQILEVEKCRFLDMAEHGGTLGQTSYGIRITQTTSDIHFSIKDNKFINPYPDTPPTPYSSPTQAISYTASAVYIHGAQSNKLRGIIDHNYANYCGQNVAGNNTSCFDLYQLSDFAIISNNWIDNAGWSAISVSDGSAPQIFGNVVTDTYFDVNQPAIYFQGYNHATTLKHDALVADNYVDWQYGVGIHVQGNSAQLTKNARILNNRVLNGYYGIYLRYADSAEISGNIVSGSSVEGIRIRDAQGRVRISGGSIKSSTDYHIRTAGTVTSLDLDVMNVEFDTAGNATNANNIVGVKNVKYIGNTHLNTTGTYSNLIQDCTGKVTVVGNSYDKVPSYTGNAALERVADGFLTTGGFQRLSVEATADITASASITITLGIPTSARLLGVQLRVDSALATGETWDAAWSGGSTTAIATAQAVAKNTKVTAMYDANAATDITSNTTNIAITKNGGGSFTAQGRIRAIAYYMVLSTMADL